LRYEPCLERIRNVECGANRLTAIWRIWQFRCQPHDAPDLRSLSTINAASWREIAGRMGCELVRVYKDHGISGTRGRDKRPAFDKLCRDAARREFDVVTAWSVDRLGRSLQDLVGFLSEVHALKIDLFLRQQGLETVPPSPIRPLISTPAQRVTHICVETNDCAAASSCGHFWT
jgi:hypothetical protein